MFSQRPSRLVMLVDRINGLQLLVVALLLTLLFALGYWYLTGLRPHEGIELPERDATVDFSDALYFSVVTETTLGYGDIRPRGFSRFLVCAQVVLGLVLAGIAVAKITSSGGRELRYATHNAAGDWIEVCQMLEGQVLVGFSTIYLSRDLLRYDGENFDSDGTPKGFFRGELVEMQGALLRFRYTNRESLTAYFAEGFCDVLFSGDGQNGRWIRHQATAHDLGTSRQTMYEGFRASVEESAIFRGGDQQARVKIVKNYAAHFPTTPPTR